MAGTLTEAAGEPTFIRALEEDSFEGAQFVFFAGNAADAERNWPAAQRAGATVIDLTGAAATATVATSQATAWIPSVAGVLPPQRNAGTNGSVKARVYLSPGAGVIIACTVAAALSRVEAQRVVMTLFPPVSERDQAGVDELEGQTTSLLSFKPIEQRVFDAQVAFNLLSAYGEEVKPSLDEIKRGVARDVTQYLRGRVKTPAIQMVQAPVFYGYAFSAYAEFGSAKTAEQLARAFGNLEVKIAGADDVLPTNVSAAGESDIQLGRIEADASVATGNWFWGVADNLRLSATNAVRIAEELVARPAN
jgi:aspartate-semialdehyde dehydrogenase